MNIPLPPLSFGGSASTGSVGHNVNFGTSAPGVAGGSGLLLGVAIGAGVLLLITMLRKRAK